MVRRLDLGSGYHPFQPDNPEWEHLDANGNVPHLEHHCSAFDPLPFDDNTFHEMRAQDLWEHVSYRRSAEVLAEWARVLAPGGVLYVCVPAADHIMKRFSQRDESLTAPGFSTEPFIVSIAWRLLGGLDDGTYAVGEEEAAYNTHLALFDEESIREYARRAGLLVDSLRVNGHPNYLVSFAKP